MPEVTSSWVARNWAATVDLAGRGPVIVRHHGRLRAVIVNDILAERFLDWLSEQPEGDAAVVSGTRVSGTRVSSATATGTVAQLRKDRTEREDRALVKMLRAKFDVRRPLVMTDAHVDILVGRLPEDRDALRAIAEEFADVEEQPLDMWP